MHLSLKIIQQQHYSVNFLLLLKIIFVMLLNMKYQISNKYESAMY